jgi:type II secretory pathway component PulF
MIKTFANRNATIGDVIGWGSLLPAIGFVVSIFSSGFGVIGNFKTMFMSLGAKLPWLTTVIINIGDPWISVFPIVLVIISIALLIILKSSMLKMIIGISTLILTTIYFKLLVVGLFGPILEMQKSLAV